MSAAAPPYPPAAVVFDLDGVLVDTEPLWGRAEQRVVRELGRRWDPAIRQLLLGRGPDDAATALARHLGDVDPAEVARRMLVAAADEFRVSVRPRPGARELVEALHGRVPLAVATNSRRVLADLALSGSDLDGYLPVMVCAEDVTAPKPDAAPYLLACARLGVRPAVAVAIEDSPIGAAAASAAGLWVIGCPSMEGTVLHAADAVIGGLGELSPTMLLEGRAA